MEPPVGAVLGSSNSNEMNNRLPYLRQVTGYLGRQMIKERPVEQFIIDHSYSKPWNSHPFASRTKPARLLFYSYPGKQYSFGETATITENVDVEGAIQQSCPPPYDIIKAKSQMNEWENHLSNVYPEDKQDDWEEQINRSSWTVQQNRLFTKVSKILTTDYLAKLSYSGSANEPVMRRIYVDKGAKRLRQILASVMWDSSLIQWLHSTLLENLSVAYLSSYLEMLHCLKAKIPVLVNKIIAMTPTIGRGSIAGTETSGLWNRKPWDPILPSLAYNKLKKLPGSPLILVVPFAPSQGVCNQTKRMRFWLSQLASMGKVVPVTMYAPGGGRSVIVTQCMEHIIGATRTKINELKDNFPNRPVILVGWGVGSVIACHVSLQERVAAVVCLGFQMTGFKGTRGDVDDPFLESHVPTLFIVGQNSPTCKIDDVEEFREKMKTETSLVIVGGADEWLRVSHYKKKEEGVTQSVVDRCLLDEISNFLGGTLTSLPFDNYNHMRYGTRQPIVRENKRRKRKLDTILEFDDEGGVEAPVAKWKASSIVKTETKTNLHPSIAVPVADKTLSPPETPFQRLNPSSDVLLKSGNKINTTTGKRSYVRKARIHIPVVPESTSSDSSSTSFVSSNKSSCPDVEEVVVNSVSNNTGPSSSITPTKTNNGLSFNIGFLSSLGQVRSRQNVKLSSKLSSSNVIIKNSETKASSCDSTPQTPVLQLYKALSNSSGKSSPMSVYSVPARSAFSIPRSGVKPTIGLSSMMTYATMSRSNNPSLVSTIHQSSDQLTEADSQKSLETDPDQVQAIQKLQFHDFPLTTVSLTKTTTGLSITQAKILSNINLDFKKLQTVTTGSAHAANSNLYIATSTKLPKQSVLSTTKEVKFEETTSNLPQNNPITSYTFSSMMSASTENKSDSSNTNDQMKISPLSVIVLTPSKRKGVEVLLKDNNLSTEEKCNPDLETKIPLEDLKNDKLEIKGDCDEMEKSTKVETQPLLDTSNPDVTKSSEDQNLNKNMELKSDEGGESSSETTSSPGTSRGKFKAPSFPTIAATRTRRVRTPKYMYYDL